MRLAFALPVLSTSALALAVALRKLDGPYPSSENEAKLQRLLKRYREQLIASPERLAELEAEFTAQVRDGLAKNVPVDGKHMMMLPTYVTRLPDGTETGECYALDLGGTNFRVMYVRLGEGPGELAACEVEEVALPREVYTGPGEALFDFLARTLSAFIARHHTQQPQSQPSPAAHNPDGKPAAGSAAGLPVVGFCFSFAVEQTGLASGRLLDWTKGFTCPGVVGNDPVALLSAALDRAGRPCRVAALLNDTVGVLAAQRYLDAHTDVGVIVGTGTNACYVERLAALTKWRPPAAAAPTAAAAGAAGGGEGGRGEGRTAVNMEWGAFFSTKLPRCMEDLSVDAASPNPGKYMFEKLLSGMFLGEAARRILLSLAREVPGLFPGPPLPDAEGASAAAGGATAAAPPPSLPGRLATPGSLSSAALAAIVEDRSWRLWATRRRLARELGVHRPSRRAAEVAQELTAMALLAVLRHNGWASASPPRPVTIAFDGAVYERFAAYRSMLTEAVSEQLGPERRAELAPLIRFALSHDGSALGAAVLAAAAVAEAQ
ncbi:hypothetical protein GPECTOR_15g301 [Gonium pectorale]|uniref:Phosphotransferase n=1 Tax=Gonium pectorale TaxID=33097 RepID=A0A150GLG2_GONPE|nr:hypothetical protein GPECTOR_15g301 [Gonium pectorale]|eukprot:KXZ50618.1 hypothetical protein GPECTOR_15g301 [Gonium pectorale]